MNNNTTTSIMQDMLGIKRVADDLNGTLSKKGQTLCSWCPRVVTIESTVLGVCNHCVDNHVEGKQ